MVKGFPSIQQLESSYKYFILVEHYREEFVPRDLYTIKVALEIIHTNLCILIITSNIYFITSIDDFSWKTSVRHQKFEAFSVFKRFKASIKNEIGKYIKYL